MSNESVWLAALCLSAAPLLCYLCTYAAVRAYMDARVAYYREQYRQALKHKQTESDD